MGSSYQFYVNPFSDVIMDYFTVNDSVEINLSELHALFVEILQNYFQYGNEVIYLDFDVNYDGYKFNFISKNLLTALWLSGIFPDKIDDIIGNNSVVLDGVKYEFNGNFIISKNINNG